MLLKLLLRLMRLSSLIKATKWTLLSYHKDRLLWGPLLLQLARCVTIRTTLVQAKSLGKLLEPWQKNTCNRLYHLVERYNLLVNEQYEEGRDTSTSIVHMRPLVFVKRFS